MPLGDLEEWILLFFNHTICIKMVHRYLILMKLFMYVEYKKIVFQLFCGHIFSLFMYVGYKNFNMFMLVQQISSSYITSIRNCFMYCTSVHKKIVLI